MKYCAICHAELSKDAEHGVLYGATAIGSLLGPHGAVVGFVLGGVICIVVDVLVSNEVDGLIDKIAK